MDTITVQNGRTSVTVRIARNLSGMLRLSRVLVPLVFTGVGLFILGPLLKQNTSLFRLRQLEEDSQSKEQVTASQPHTATEPSVPRPSGNIKVLSWTQDNITNWPVGLDAFAFCKLPEGKTCESVVDRSKYNESEVILFHGQVLDTKDMPHFRLPFHKWMFYEIETPPQTWIQQDSLDSIRNVFNLTSTITFDSHIPITERHRVCKVYEDKLKPLREKPVNYASGKGHRVAWFVSHCDTPSLRERYAVELSKYIPVDIWGKCGNFSCGDKFNRGDCDTTVINKDYKFYLSFENSICEGYVTEKLWRLILQPITAIPIVLGGVDYKKILPADTFLDIKDFPSPQALAERLKEIDADDSVFNEMITQKNSLICKHPGDKWYHQVRYQCELCQYLHEHRHEVTEVKDVLEFWYETKRCTKPTDYFKGSMEI